MARRRPEDRVDASRRPEPWTVRDIAGAFGIKARFVTYLAQAGHVVPSVFRAKGPGQHNLYSFKDVLKILVLHHMRIDVTQVRHLVFEAIDEFFRELGFGASAREYFSQRQPPLLRLRLVDGAKLVLVSEESESGTADRSLVMWAQKEADKAWRRGTYMSSFEWIKSPHRWRDLCAKRYRLTPTSVIEVDVLKLGKVLSEAMRG